MKVARFNTRAPLILVRGVLEGPLGRARLRLALGTGSEHTLIVPEILDELGYSARRGEAITSIVSAIGREPGYLLRVEKFGSIGHQARDFRVHAHDLPEGIGIDGLLGLSFLRQLCGDRVERLRDRSSRSHWWCKDFGVRAGASTKKEARRWDSETR